MSKISPHDFHLRREGDKEWGLRVGMSMDLQLIVGCPLAERYYPYDKNRCLVRLASYDHGHKSATFVRVKASSSHVKFKDLTVEVEKLCKKEVVGGIDGFKITLKRDGHALWKRYEKLTSLFVWVATLSVLLPLVWRGSGIRDQGGPIVEVMVIAFYILFSIYGKIPPTSDQEGADIILASVEYGNVLVNLAGIWFLVNMIFRRLKLRLFVWYVPNMDFRIMWPFKKSPYKELADEEAEDLLGRVTCPHCLEKPTSRPLHSCKKKHILCNACYTGPAASCLVCRAKTASKLKSVQSVVNMAFLLVVVIYGVGIAVYWKKMQAEANAITYHNAENVCGN